MKKKTDTLTLEQHKFLSGCINEIQNLRYRFKNDPEPADVIKARKVVEKWENDQHKKEKKFQAYVEKECKKARRVLLFCKSSEEAVKAVEALQSKFSDHQIGFDDED